MADMGINAPKEATDPTLAQLHREEQYHECKARIAGLRKTIHATEQDIAVKRGQMEKCEKEIQRLQAHLDSMGR